MTLIEEVVSFSREYINSVKSRTSERKEKIRVVYKALTGENVRISCGTCYVEALLIINNRIKMGPCNYLLKKGARLTAFGNYSKNCTNQNITNELAEWHLRINPGCARLFERMPDNAPVNLANVKLVAPPANITIVPPVITIIPPVKKEEVKPEVKAEVKLPGVKKRSNKPKK